MFREELKRLKQLPKWYKDHNFYKIVGICFLIALLGFSLNLIRNGGLLTINTDYELQQTPINMAMGNAIKSGNTGFQWNIDLGTSLNTAYSYYNLYSPFFWVTIPFASFVIPYLLGFLYVVKFALMGGFAYLYIRRFTAEERSAMVGALLYAFSGFGLACLCFQFHDILVFFPLLLISLEQLVVEKKRGRFAVMVLLSAILNYYFFVSEVVFLVLYFCCRFVSIKHYKETLANLLNVFLEGLCGVLLSGIIFIPSIISVLANPRTGFVVNDLIFDNTRYEMIVQGLIMPAAAKNNLPFVEARNFYYENAWLPFAGGVFALAYMWKHKKAWQTKLLLICFIMMLSPILTALFVGRTIAYQRWLFMPILIAALASSLVIEKHKEYRIMQFAAIAVVMVVAYVIYLNFYDRVLNPNLYVLAAIAAASALLIFVFYLLPHFRRNVAIATVLVSIITLSLCTYWYNNNEWIDHLPALREAMSEVYQPDDNYRYLPTGENDGGVVYNNYVSFLAGIQPSGTYISTTSPGVFELYKAFDQDRDVGDDIFSEDLKDMYRWVGTRYRLIDKERADLVEQYQDEPVVYEGERFIVYDEPACPISYTYDTYILEDDFYKLDAKTRQIVAMYALVSKDKLEGLTRVSDYNGASAEDMIELAESRKLTIEDKTSYSFRLTGDFTAGQYAFLSVPTGAGWHAYVNGEEIKTESNLGLIRIRIPEGATEIDFKFKTFGLDFGKFATASGVILFAFYLVVTHITDRRAIIKK